MYLIDNYSLQNFKKPNYALLKPLTIESITIEYRGLSLPTGDPTVFSHYSPGDLRNLFDTQVQDMEKELQVLQRY